EETVVLHGSTDRGELDATVVERAELHPGWKGGTGGDLALLVLAAPLGGATPAPLAPRPPASGSSAWLAGWGATATSGTGHAATLVEGVATVRDEADYPVAADLSTVLWVGGLEGEADTCPGDSGGPLLGGTGALVGVVSRAVPWASTPCGEGGLYTDL